MLNIFRKFRKPKEDGYSRIAAHSNVNFRIIDSKNLVPRSQLLQGEVFDLSAEGLCIGTTMVKADEIHIFHQSSQNKNRLEVEVDLGPCISTLKTYGEIKWYSHAKNDKGSLFKMVVKWLSLSESDRQTLNNFLETKTT